MMRPVVIVLFGLVSVGQLVLGRHSNLHEWNQYKLKHGKVYETAEEDSRRFSLFLAAKDRIQRHNAATNASYKKGLNHLSDWMPEEFAMLNGFRYELKLSKGNTREAMQFMEQLVNATGPVPDEVDWRKYGRVTSVKFQGSCASCWAFATVGVLEGQELARNSSKRLTSLSAQNLVDCSRKDMGCNGGDMASALEDIQAQGGIETEKDYPYSNTPEKLEQCRYDAKKAFMTDDGALIYQNMSEIALKDLVASFGPVSVGVATEGWIDYVSGVLDEPTCGFHLDHAVLIVGYGTDPKQGDYWLVKNSWSELWGDEGYIRIKRGVGRCGLGLVSVIPKFNK